MADRLNISKASQDIVNTIDETNFFELGKTILPRSDLFLFAMALGYEVDTPTELKNTYPGGFILKNSIASQTLAAMKAVFIEEKCNDMYLESATNDDLVYSLAQQYANTGFQIIEDYIRNSKEEDLMFKLLAELDEKYLEITK